MAKLVLVVLRRLDHVGQVESLVVCKVNLNLTTAASATLVKNHVFVKLCNGVVVWPRADIKHQGVLWLKILANTLEEPFMRIDFAVVTLFQGEYKVNATSIQSVCFLQAKVPSAYLKQMQSVFGNRTFRHVFLH